MAIATGVFKKLSRKRQTALNVQAPSGGAGTAQYMRRVTSDLALGKATFQSAEILASQQRRDVRHGVRNVKGTIAGELSVGAYQNEFESVLRQNAIVGGSTAANTGISAASTTGAQGTFTRAAGSFITDGFYIGDVVQFAGFSTTGLPNNAHNMMIIGLTATVMTVVTLDKVAVANKASGDNVSISTPGKFTFPPSAGQTRNYHTIEHWHSDIGQSEQFTDCVYGGASVSLPPSGDATVSFPVMGLNAVTGVSEYFTTPATAAAGPILAGVNGVLMLNGAVVGLVTGLSFDINGNYSVPGGVVGSNVDPDVFPGPIDVTGSVSILFQDGTIRDLFYNETEFNVAIALTGNNTPNAPFASFVMSRVKATDATKDDGTGGLTITAPFTALEQVANGGTGTVNRATTISMQDSAYV